MACLIYSIFAFIFCALTALQAAGSHYSSVSENYALGIYLVLAVAFVAGAVITRKTWKDDRV